MGSRFPRWGVWLFVGLGAALVAVGITLGVVWALHQGSDSTSAGRPQKLAASLTVGQLATEFRENEGAADLRYKGKLIEVSGLGARLNKEDDGRYYVSEPYGMRAAHKHGTMFDQAPAVPLVYCYIADGAAKKFADLPPSNTITVRGVYKTTRSTPKTMPEFFIVLEDCTLAP